MQTTFRLLDFDCSVFYSISSVSGCSWRWKLDPYTIAESNEIALTIELQYPEKKTAPYLTDSLLRVEPAGFYSHQVFRQKDNSTVWRYVRNRSEKAYLSYYVDEKWQRIVLQEDYTESAGVLAFEYLGQIMPSIFLNHYALSFHGVLMEYQGKGIIISAESGTGKTTHARLWRELENALIVNGDCATVQKKENIWTGFGIPWSGTSGEQVNRRNPLKALVVLERHAENEAHRISGIEALSAILPHVKYPAWDKILTNKMFDLLEKFLCEIPIIRLRCRPDGEAVKVLKKALEEL